MDAVDNPSYFSLPLEAPKKSRNFLSLRKWSDPSKNVNFTTLPGQRHASNAPPQSRRNFRSLTRATSEDTHLLVLGKPRPSDLAPSVYASSRHQRHSSTGNVSSNDLMHQDMVHCDGGDNDVFFTAGRNAQYYNTATLPVNRILNAARRRHSIGSFLNRDRTVPNNGAEKENKSRESASVRRKLKKNPKGGGKMVEDELDILLVSCGESEAATLWVNYLITCFQQISRERNKPPFKLQNIKLEDTLCSSPASKNLIERLPDAKLQIVVICPYFFQKVQATPASENMLLKIIHPDKILAMLLGVQDHVENDRLSSVFRDYDRWRKMNVKDQDPTFVGDFLGVSMDVLSRAWQMQEMMSAEQEQPGYSIIPKKVKVGQNKLIVLFTDPVSAKDSVTVFVNMAGQHIEVTTVKRRNPYTLQFTMPACCLQLSTLVSVCIEKNGKSMGRRMVKCESKMRELEQLLKSLDNPIEFLCQSFGLSVNDRDHLDTFLLHNFQRNVPAHFNLLTSPSPILRSSISLSNEEYPTLLHFSAKYGLERLSWQLMESPGGEQACHKRNGSHLTPADMAEKANHDKLAKVLKGYMQMNELSSVYTYLKGMSERERQLAECNYLLPRPLSDTYLIPPAARPVDPLAVHSPTADLPGPSFPYYTNFKPSNFSIFNATSPTSSVASSAFLPSPLENYDFPSNGRPYSPRTPPTPRSPVESKMEAYLDMNSTGNESSRFSSVSSYNTNTDLPEHFGSFSKLDTYERASVSSEQHPPSKYGSINQLSNREKLSPDDELLEIINDFKNNVFTIAEVETLVESWQNRNDVQQSFRDKQDQLNRMRDEYEKIQRRMKDQLKRTTPFERIRKFFGRGKPKPEHENSSDRTSVSSDASAFHQIRPASSLSLHSSSSGSSGAHSINSSHYTAVGSHKQQPLATESLEKINNSRSHPYAEIPQPPKYLNLGVNVDFCEYVQPDSTPSPSGKMNNRQSCNASILNETIQECNELETSDSHSIYSHASSKGKQQKKFVGPSAANKSNRDYKSNSLRLKSESKMMKHQIRNKVKSAENLISDREYTNKAGISSKIDLNEREGRQSPSSVKFKPSAEFSACATLCAETLKCLSDMNISRTGAEEPESSADITFKFDSTPSATSSTSECESAASNSHKSSSSLDLSSLSLNSTCTIDENCEIREEKYSLELNVTEEADNETDTAPSASTMIEHQTYTNMPEYVNVNISAAPPLNETCKYTCTVLSL